VPGWHVSTLEWQQAGRLQVVGIVQEQHPDRARLFMQWQQLPWPVLADPLNQLAVTVVPITLLLDEHGVIRKVNPSREDVAAFVAEPVAEVKPSPARPVRPDIEPAPDPANRLSWAETAALWGDAGQLDEAIRIYTDLLREPTADGVRHFRAGVAFRKRYDSQARQRGDFQAAAAHWTRALELNPNQYIWRRRVQQYGPRLDKPYAFYDWVPAARREITARGETPVPLGAEPGGAEFAAPTRESGIEKKSEPDPDPADRIHLDDGGLIQAEVTVVPARVKPGEVVRVHVEFRPNAALKAHWNNEVDGLEFQVRPPVGWNADPGWQRVPLPAAVVSQEVRSLECELIAPANAAGEIKVPAYALYYVCEDATGTCLYRRLNLSIPIPVRE
jgi:tetratricopeptide (TPR) repeat protein